MGKKKTKQFFKSDENTSVYEHGKFIFAYKENGTKDIYEKKRKSCKLLIASNVKEFYHRNGYLFFLCQDSKTGWSCKKEGDIKALHLGDAIGDFFVLNSHHGYKISFFGIDGFIRSITKCSEYFYNEQKDLLIIKRNGWYQLWKREDYWKTLSDTIMVSSCRYFSPHPYRDFSFVYILRDVEGVEWGFVPDKRYDAGGVRKLRKADSLRR